MSNSTTKAVRFHEYGGLEKLVVDEVARPAPKANEVLIRMKSAGVNPADWKFRAGYMKDFAPIPLPWTSGLDGAGVVEAVGAEAKSFRPGQAVFGIITGSYAEYAVAAAGDIVAKPDQITFEQAAAVPVGALTAWQAIIEDAQAHDGQRILVLGAAGGVGLFAVQLAKWKGASVTGTASAANLAYVRSLGAEAAIDYSSPSEVAKLEGFDVVLDTVGGETLESAWRMVKRGGLLLSIAGMVDPKRAEGLGIRAKYTGRAATSHIAQITELIQSKKVVPKVGKVFPLTDARKAQELSQTGHGTGRIVLHIAD